MTCVPFTDCHFLFAPHIESDLYRAAPAGRRRVLDRFGGAVERVGGREQPLEAGRFGQLQGQVETVAPAHRRFGPVRVSAGQTTLPVARAE